MNNDVLIYDIETRVFGKPDYQRDQLRIFACYSYKTNKFYLLRSKDQIQKIIDAHHFLVGFNNVGTKDEPGYDNPILEREGINLKFKVMIDLRSIFKSRSSQMMIKEGILNDLLMEYSLDYITRTIGIVDKDTAKLDIDYKKFMKDIWTPEELKEICDYAKRDIEVTKRLYEWVEDYFGGFKDFLTEEDVKKKIYLTASLAKVAYKAICKGLNWKEEYGKDVEGDERIKGGYVAYPAGGRFEGDIYQFDYTSLYPHVMIQCNLYGRKKVEMPGIKDERPLWNGGNKWTVMGQYYADRLAGVSELLRSWFALRQQYKKEKNPKQYNIKIFLNIVYGILNNPYYTNVYDRVAGGDCTGIARQWTLYIRKRLRDEGYKLLYGDTDSLFLLDKFNDKTKLMNMVKNVIEEIKASVPFPQETFSMALDDEIKYMFFFKGGNKDKDEEVLDEDDFINKPLGFMKKNYLYVTKDNNVKIKNLGIKKKSNSPLSRKIFWEYLVPKIKEGQILFSREYIKNLITTLLKEDLTLAAMRKEVGNFEQYGKSQGSLPAQIAQRYSSGIHFLIPNTAGVGAGKGKKFCTVDEFKEHNLRLEHIDLDNVWMELDYFIKPAVTTNIFQFDGK